LVGHDIEVLIEGVSQRNSTRWSGRTRTNKIVIVEPIETMDGPCMVDVRVERGMPQTLHGKVVRLAASYRIKRPTLGPNIAKGDVPCPH
ncbi:MAG: TRAM domain-containing protein, partial [bacterium]